MKDSDIFTAGILFMASLAKRSGPGERWPVDNRTFTFAVDRAAADGNRYAKKFFVSNSVVGRYCVEYETMLSMMMHAGLISYLSPEYREFVLNIGLRAANALIDRDDATPEEVQSVEDFLTYYQESATPWNAAI